MARSDITAKTIDIISDNGALLFSVAQGEQLAFQVTLNWLTDLTDFTIVAKVVEGDNVPGQGTTPPTTPADTPQVTTLPIIDDTVTDNILKIVIPSDLANAWDVQPAPDDPVYGFFGLSVSDAGSGNAQQTYVPLRGLIEVRYNPAVAS